MEQRPFVGDRRSIFDNQRARRERRGDVDFAESARGNDARARRSCPDRGKMRLAGTLRPDKRDGPRRPIRPGIDERQSVSVARPR
jgi:hypothetical protein